MRSFASSWHALVSDVGIVLPAIAAAVVAGLLVWALRDPGAARDGYLRLAIAHGHLELAVIALLLVEGVRPRNAPADSA
jgi:predicted small integral membrane protein